MVFVEENIFLILIAVVSGAMLLWPAIAGRAAAGVGLDPLAATRLINDRNPHVVDIRPMAEFSAGHLIKAKCIAPDELGKRASELKGRPVLLYCASGARTSRLVGQLKKEGVEEVFSLTGGLQAWQKAGLPVVK